MTSKEIIEAVGELTDLDALDDIQRAVRERRQELYQKDSGYTPLGVDVEANPGINPAKKGGPKK